VLVVDCSKETISIFPIGLRNLATTPIFFLVLANLQIVLRSRVWCEFLYVDQRDSRY